MTKGSFKASVQYNDWEGTSAADSADQVNPSKWLRDNGHLQDGEFLLGLKMYTDENYGTHTDPVYVDFLIAIHGDYESVKSMIDSSDGSIEVKCVTVDMNLSDFFALFKRFEVALSSHGTLEGHEYHYYNQ